MTDQRFRLPLLISIVAIAISPWVTHSQDDPKPPNEDPALMVQRAAQLMASGQRDAAAETAARAAKLAGDSARILQYSAEILYRTGRSKQSVALFDKVVELEPSLAAGNWQRGIALCSVGDFQRGGDQFRIHHTVNPDDVENSAWYFLCIAKTDGIEAARKTVIPSRGDGRQPMMTILQMLKGEVEPESVFGAALKNTNAGRDRERGKFYADLYVGLYYDSLGEDQQAANYLKRSLKYDYSGYMVDVARVYFNDRFPQQSAAATKDQ